MKNKKFRAKRNVPIKFLVKELPTLVEKKVYRVEYEKTWPDHTTIKHIVAVNEIEAALFAREQFDAKEIASISITHKGIYA